MQNNEYTPLKSQVSHSRSVMPPIVSFPSLRQLRCHGGDTDLTSRTEIESLTKIWHPPKCASSLQSDTLRLPTVPDILGKTASCPPPDLLVHRTCGEATGSLGGAGSSLPKEATHNQSQAKAETDGVSVKLQKQSVRGHAFPSGTFNTHSLPCHQCLTHAFLSFFFAFTMQPKEPRNSLFYTFACCTFYQRVHNGWSLLAKLCWFHKTSLLQ